MVDGSAAAPVRYAEAQAARILQVSPKTLQRYRRAGLIGYNRTPGGRIHYSPDQLTAFAASLRVEARLSSQV